MKIILIQSKQPDAALYLPVVFSVYNSKYFCTNDQLVNMSDNSLFLSLYLKPKFAECIVRSGPKVINY